MLHGSPATTIRLTRLLIYGKCFPSNFAADTFP